MDVSLIHTPVTEDTNQRTLEHFAAKSTNYPTSNLTRRPGVRRDQALSQEVVATAEKIQDEEKQAPYTSIRFNGSSKRARSIDGKDLQGGSAYEYQTWAASVKNWNENKEISGSAINSSLTHNDRIDKKTTELGINRMRNYSPASVSLTGTEWRRSLPTRSRSVDWRSGASSPDRDSRRSNVAAILPEENKSRVRDTEGLRERSLSSFRKYSSLGISPCSISPRNSLGQSLETVYGSNSCPLRLKSDPQPIGDSRETSSFGTKRGQSILERIEKLYGPSKPEDFSRFRDFSSLDRRYLRGKGDTTVHRRSSFYVLPSSCGGDTRGTDPRRGSVGDGSYQSTVCRNGSLVDTKTESSNTSHCSRTRAKLPEGEWDEWIYGGYSNQGVVRGGIRAIETMSLDRARSRNTRANQVRSARLAHPNTLSGKTSLFELPEATRKPGTQGERTMSKKGKVTEDMELKLYEEVFEPNLNNGVISAGWKTHSETHSPLISVRNKINQFEALTQKSQGFGENMMPRRAFSVPTRLNTAHDCLKDELEKAGRITGEKCLGLREFKETGRNAHEKASQSQRSFSADEIGQRFRGADLARREGANMDGVYKCTEDFSYSKFKSAVESPLKYKALLHENLYIDEPDSFEISSDQNQKNNNSESPTSLCSSDSEAYPYAELSGVKKAKPSVIILPVSDDDKTPTNTPSQSPLSSPMSPPDSSSPLAPTEKTQTAIAPKPDLSTLTTIPHSKLFPDIIDGESKGKKHTLDLDAWVAGFKAWKPDDALEDDDDDSTQKDDDSYDSDSAESSVTVTSNMSLSDRRSFSLSLAELCYFTGAESESENDSDESPMTGRRSASLSSEVSALSYVSVLPSEELDKLLEDVRSLGDSNLQEDVHVVVLHKEMAAGLGFSIAGGVDQNKPVVVHKVFPTGVAAQEGSIREGNQVLSINGTALGGHTHWEALRVLRRAKTREMGVVVLRRGDITNICDGKESKTKESTPCRTTETGQCIRVHLEKKSRDLGFSLEGGVGLGDKPLTVQKIFQGGPVDKISPGDQVMQIEGMSMVGMRRLEAWSLIRRLPSGPVDVVIRRPRKTSEP
ncbi:uncharacterized protein LOC144073325 [Stigmatopora argus]